MAMVEEDGAATETVSVPVAGLALVTLMLRAAQLTPGNAPQVMATLPVNPPLGVTVTVDVPELPAVTVTGVAVIETGVTFTVMAVEVDVA